MSIIHQPQDKLFKQSMSDIKVAREFFENHLPAELLKQIDLSTLKLEKESFIDEQYKASEADVVYSVKLCNRIDTTYVYVLCEQQSKIDEAIAFRILVYTVRIMEMHRKKYPRSQLPLVYPLVLYSGEKIWNAPMDIFAMFGKDEALAREYLFQPYQLIDLH